MLFTSPSEFVNYVNKIKTGTPLTREQVKEFAIKLKQGDEKAREKLVDNYLPYLYSTIKKYSTGEPSLELIYRAKIDLNELIDSHNFLKENDSFTRALSFKLRKTITKFIADSW